MITPYGQDWALETRQEQLRRKREKRKAEAGMNLANSIADLDVPFPWETELRAFSPIVEKVSHLRAYWYRAGMRWVLYQCIPLALMPDDERKVRPDLTGSELFDALRGRPQRMRGDDEEPSPISDLQHEFARRFGVWAGPLWVLQGERGGHFWKLDPWQQNVAIAKGHSGEMPAIGILQACPFDQRVITSLQQHNRLRQLGDRLEALQKSSTVDAANVEMDAIQREIRVAEMALIERQLEPLVEMTSSIGKKSDYQDQVIHVPGMAAKAKDAYAQYADNGLFTLKM